MILCRKSASRFDAKAFADALAAVPDEPQWKVMFCRHGRTWVEHLGHFRH